MRVEHALQRRERQSADAVEQLAAEARGSASKASSACCHRSRCSTRRRRTPSAVQVLGETAAPAARSGRRRSRSASSGARAMNSSIPAQHLGGLLERPEHRPGVDRVAPGAARNRNEVTTPKFPPPPRIAQNRSAFSSSLAVTKLPSASTMSTASRLSIARPYLRVRWPSPPPSVSPPTPVVEMIPLGTASPYAWVAWSTSPQSRRPRRAPCARSGSTSMSRIGERSITRPSSQTPRPPAL